jgi:hypothetical protein
MEATYSSETSVDVHRITRRCIPEDKTPFIKEIGIKGDDSIYVI